MRGSGEKHSECYAVLRRHHRHHDQRAGTAEGLRPLQHSDLRHGCDISLLFAPQIWNGGVFCQLSRDPSGKFHSQSAQAPAHYRGAAARPHSPAGPVRRAGGTMGRSETGCGFGTGRGLSHSAVLSVYPVSGLQKRGFYLVFPPYPGKMRKKGSGEPT